MHLPHLKQNFWPAERSCEQFEQFPPLNVVDVGEGAVTVETSVYFVPLFIFFYSKNDFNPNLETNKFANTTRKTKLGLPSSCGTTIRTIDHFKKKIANPDILWLFPEDRLLV